MRKNYEGLQLLGVSACVPKRILELSALADQFGAEETRRIIGITGVERVRVTPAEITASDLCYRAAEELLQGLDFPKTEIDALIFVSSTPDYLGNPTSPILQHRLGLSTEVLAFDVNYACSGFTYGLLLASSLVSGGSVRSVLLLVGETPTRSVDANDRSMRFLFGDAGTAALLTSGSERFHFLAGTDGSGHRSIFTEGGGYRRPEGDRHMRMSGLEVMSFVSSTVIRAIEELLAGGNVTARDVDTWFFHQANKMILDYCAMKLQLPHERVPSCLKDFGNTGGSSLPLLLCDLKKRGIRLGGGNSVFAGFGVGLSWAMGMLPLKGCRVLPWSEYP